MSGWIFLRARGVNRLLMSLRDTRCCGLSCSISVGGRSKPSISASSIIGFTKSRGALKKIHPDIDRIAKQIVEDLLEQGDETSVDFVEKVSAPLPIAVIGWLLGVPEPDWPKLFDWTNRMLGADDSEYNATDENESQNAIIELFTYFTHLVRHVGPIRRMT